VQVEKNAETASEDEVSGNPRARSAKLRSGVRTAAASWPVDFDALGVPVISVGER
jgi:16S rRNA (cytosine1402-N4)-methyltransferase